MFMTITSDAYTQLKELKEKAINDFLEIRANLIKKFNEESATLKAKFDSNLKAVGEKLAELGHHSQEKKVSTTATRRRLAKVTDDELKAKLAVLLAGGKGVSSTVIFETCGIARERFNNFLKANPDFIVTTGRKRTTLYFLKS